MQKIKLITLISLTLCLSIFTQARSETSSSSLKKQPKSIRKIIQKEKSTARTRRILNIVKQIDATYQGVYNLLSKGGKITIFFDPAHGRLSSGVWQGGAATLRQSCTNKPEEFYSIIISRKMYKRLSSNPFIEIKSTEDFMKVLKGESDEYDNIPFSKTISMANTEGAFIIIAEHLNNVSVRQKASGIINIPGIHITRDKRGRKILKYVSDSHRGFLTLYNRLDASGFSKSYAVNLKNRLVEKGLKPNSWQHGAVADDRFSYFVDFPISVIYESGFISNPEEEKLLREDREYTDTIAEAQYTTLLKTLKDIFKVDISGPEVKKTGSKTNNSIELLKLSRIAVYYIKQGRTKSGLYVINKMESRFGKTFLKGNISYFKSIQKKLKKSEKYYRLGVKNRTKKRYRTSRRYFKKAYATIDNAPIFNAYRKKYARSLGIRKRARRTSHHYHYKKTVLSMNVTRAPRRRTILFPVEKNQTLEDAIKAALDPDEKTLKKLVSSFNKAYNTKWKKIRYYSKKHKKYVTTWKKRKIKVHFRKGIYLVSIDRNLYVYKAKRISSATMNPAKYQNQQYLKNSYFARKTREKAL